MVPVAYIAGVPAEAELWLPGLAVAALCPCDLRDAKR